MPGRHIGAIPDDDLSQQGTVARFAPLRTNLVHVGIQAAWLRFKESLERAQETDVLRPNERTVGSGVGNGVTRETGLRVGLGHDAPDEKVRNRALASARTAHDD